MGKMKEKYEALRRPLKIEEIEFRVQSVSGSGYATIVPYKDARTDMTVLNESGVVHQRKHELIDGQLFCSIGIWDEDISQWVWRQDVGTESNTEKEKGRASDSFKRAGTNWGIGMELYEMPRLMCKVLDSEANGKKMYMSDWTWTITKYDSGYHVVGRDKSGRIRIDAGAPKGSTMSANVASGGLDSLTPSHKNWDAVKAKVASGTPIETIKKHYKLTATNEKKLLA